MQKILGLPKDDLREVFLQTAFKMGISQPSIIEKDFWVVYLLNLLFSEESFFENHVFKGGTSLSKCFGLIERFSEDCDITISRHLLGFNESLETVSELGSKKRKRYFEELTDAANLHVRKISKELSQKIAVQLNYPDWKIIVDNEDQQKIIFEYPRSLQLSIYPDDSYVKPKILLEFGCRGELNPSVKVNISTYAESAFENVFSKNNVWVNALAPERTFWEKITLLHMLANQDNEKALQDRMARHYYDVYKLANSDVAKTASNNIDLLTSVAQHKSIYFKSAQASYETAKPGSLKIIPSEFLLGKIENDYNAMSEMFFGEPILFSDILKNLTELENMLNRLKS